MKLDRKFSTKLLSLAFGVMLLFSGASVAQDSSYYDTYSQNRLYQMRKLRVARPAARRKKAVRRGRVTPRRVRAASRARRRAS